MLKFTKQIRCWEGAKPCLSHDLEQIRSSPRRGPTAQGLSLFPSTLHFKWGMCIIACPSPGNQARPGWQRGHMEYTLVPTPLLNWECLGSCSEWRTGPTPRMTWWVGLHWDPGICLQCFSCMFCISTGWRPPGLGDCTPYHWQGHWLLIPV